MKLIFILFLFPIQLFAQDISGVWTGYLYNDTTRQNIQYELAVNQDGQKLSGYSHTIFIIDSVKNVGVKSVKIKSKNGHFFIEDDKLIYNNYVEPPAKGVRSFSELSLSENDSSEVLSGNWWTNATKIYNSLTGTVFLERKKARRVEETLIVKKLAQLGLADRLSFLNSVTTNDLIAINNSPVSKTKKTSDEIAVNDHLKQNEKSSSSMVEKEPVVLNKVVEKSVEVENRKPDSAPQNRKEETVTVISHEPAKKPLIQKEKPVPAPQNKKESVAVTTKKNEKNSLAGKNEKIQQKDTTVRSKNADVAVAQKKGAFEDPVSKSKSFQKNNVPPKVLDAVPEVATAAAEITKRKIETIRTVEIVEDSLVFSLYDNGSVDGDTVSVVLNGKVIIPRVGLLGKPFNKTVYLTPEMGNTISVVMYAENLGSIPPNTGLLVIRERGRIFEIRFSGDLKKNSEIILKRVQKE